MTTGYFYHDDCTLHDMGSRHPESPARIRAIDKRVRESGLDAQLTRIEPSPVDRESLYFAHAKAYLQKLDEVSPEEGLVHADPDTLMNPHSMRAAALAAGSAVEATNKVLAGELDNAFCAVRPPGHHAEHSSVMGFCFYNNVAVAAFTALQNEAIERVAIIDFDVHHGNGTVDIFKDDERVMVCSSFQYPFYPGRYQETDLPNIINTPLADGSTGREFRNRVEADWLLRLQQHKPQLVLISAGFDAHRDDPLGGLKLDVSDYQWVTELISSIANDSAEGRIVSLLEGGYNLDALAESACAHIAGLVD